MRPSADQRHQAIVRRSVGLMAMDALAWSFGLFASNVLRMDFTLASVHWGSAAELLPLALILALGMGFVTHQYGGRHRIGSADEVGSLVTTDVAATAALFIGNLVVGRPVPASVPVAAGLVALASSAGARLLWRRRREQRLRPSTPNAIRLLVMGAGNAGASIVEQLLHSPDSAYLPVAFLDDAPQRRELRISGVPVLGGRGDLARVATLVDARALLFAIPSSGMAALQNVSPRSSPRSTSARSLCRRDYV